MNRPGDNLTMEGVSIRYGQTPVVEALDLSIPPERFTALLGPNGCGKSTILRALARLQLLHTGRVLLDGRAIATMGSKDVARRIGLLPQGAGAPDGLRVRDLIRQGRYPHRALFGSWSTTDEAAVQEAMDLTGTRDLADRPLDALSGGQRQRAWIAMVLAQSSPILLLDEPTTYLDLAHQLDLLSLVRRLVDERGQTVVAILHDLNQAARFADRLILVQHGRVMAEGEVDEVLSPELIAQVFGVEVSMIRDPETGRPFCIPRRTLSQ